MAIREKNGHSNVSTSKDPCLGNQKHFKKKFPELGESTVRSFKEKYLSLINLTVTLVLSNVIFIYCYELPVITISGDSTKHKTT